MESAIPEDRWIDAGGLRLHVRLWPGGGAPLVLLHGLASNSRTWDAVAESLSKAGHPVVTVDQRGHGLSDKPAYGYGFAEVTSDLKRLLEALALEELPIIAGQSWGGNVVLDFAARYPGAVRGLVLVDGGFLELSARPGATWDRIAVELRPPPLAGIPRAQIEGRLRQMHPDWTEVGIGATLANFEILPDDTVRPWLSLDRHMAILRSLWEHHPRELYARVQLPVLITPAESVETDELAEMKRALVKEAEISLARSRVRWFPRTDHDIQVHRPEELASTILEALHDGFFS